MYQLEQKKLKLDVVHGVENKLMELEKFSLSTNITLKEIAYLGNDVNDAACMKRVNFPIAVADAVEDIKMIAKVVLNKKGGYGAVRELCEMIYQSYQND